MSDDLISREAALDELNQLSQDNFTIDDWFHTYNAALIDADGKIRELPSAQPEIIRCNSCKYWTQSTGEMKGYGLGRCDFHDADLVACNG